MHCPCTIPNPRQNPYMFLLRSEKNSQFIPSNACAMHAQRRLFDLTSKRPGLGMGACPMFQKSDTYIGKISSPGRCGTLIGTPGSSTLQKVVSLWILSWVHLTCLSSKEPYSLPNSYLQLAQRHVSGHEVFVNVLAFFKSASHPHVSVLMQVQCIRLPEHPCQNQTNVHLQVRPIPRASPNRKNVLTLFLPEANLRQ